MSSMSFTASTLRRAVTCCGALLLAAVGSAARSAPPPILWKSGEMVNRDQTFTPDGKHLLAVDSSSSVAQFWDLETGRLARTFPFHGDGGLTYSEGGDLLIYRSRSFGQNISVAVYRASDGKFLHAIDTGYRPAVNFSPNYYYLLLTHRPESSGSTGNPSLWDLRTGKQIKGFGEKDRFFKFSPDSRLIAYFTPDSVVVSRTDTGEVVRTLDVGQIPRGSSLGLDFSPDSKVLSVQLNGQARFYRLDTGAILGGFNMGVGNVAFSPDGQWLTASTAEGLHLFRYNGGDPQSVAKLPTGDPVFSPDSGYLAVVSEGQNTPVAPREVELYRLEGGAAKPVFKAPFDYWMRFSNFTPDSRGILVYRYGGERPGLEMLNTADGTSRWRVESVYADLRFSPDGKYLVEEMNFTTRIFLAETGEILYTRGPAGTPAAITWDEKTLATVSYDSVRFWETKTGRDLGLLRVYDTRSTAFNLTGDKFLTTQGESVYNSYHYPALPESAGQAQYWSVKDRTLIRSFPHPAPVTASDVGWTSGNIATGTGSVKLVDQGNSEKILEERTDNRVRIWKEDGTLLRTLGPFNSEVRAVAYTLREEYLAVALKEGKILLFKPSDGSLVRSWDAAISTSTAPRGLKFDLQGNWLTVKYSSASNERPWNTGGNQYAWTWNVQKGSPVELYEAADYQTLREIPQGIFATILPGDPYRPDDSKSILAIRSGPGVMFSYDEETEGIQHALFSPQTSFIAYDKSGGEVVLAYTHNVSTQLRGDVNSDGAVNAADAVLALQMIINPRLQQAQHLVTAADVKTDGEINIQDVVLILQIAVGLIPS